MFTMAVADWLFPLFRWIIEKLPEFHMGIYGIEPLTNMLTEVRPIFPMRAVGISLMQWTAVSGLTVAVVGARIWAKVLSVVRGGAW